MEDPAGGGHEQAAALRSKMVERQLRRRGIADQRVLAAMEQVPRELFVPEDSRERAYEDRALKIGRGQTISQPWVVAAIVQALALTGDERVLEVGTGSGYSAAVLARLTSAPVVSVERIPELAEGARAALEQAGAQNVEVVVGDGSRGVPERAPFDAIAVHAAAPSTPRSLLEQLAPGGRLVVPVAEGGIDALLRIVRHAGAGGPEYSTEHLAPTRFVPLIGDEGYSD